MNPDFQSYKFDDEIDHQAQRLITLGMYQQAKIHVDKIMRNIEHTLKENKL